MSPLQGSLFIYPHHPGRRGPAGHLPWAFMSRPCGPPFRLRPMPVDLTVTLIRCASPQRLSRGAEKAPKGRDITAQGKHAGGVRRPG